jgi:hypothetical protein
LICKKDSEDKKIDARTSDAIALAIRFKAPIYTTEEIIEKAGIYLKSETVHLEDTEMEVDALLEDGGGENLPDQSLKHLSLKELNTQLDQAIKNEQYEVAALIRDEINKR